jgi:hypothetical protein
MKNIVKLIGITALVAVIGFSMAGCSKGGSSSGGGSTKAVVAEANKIAKEEGRIGKNFIFDKEIDFAYELVKIDGTDYIRIKGINVPADFKATKTLDNGDVKQNDWMTIIIPETIEGYTVGVIGERAFSRSYILAVTIPDTVIEIGDRTSVDGSFESSGIRSIKLPANLKIINSDAFRESQLTGTLIIPDGVTEIRDLAFSRTKITELVIPDSITHIGGGAFAVSRELTTVTIPSKQIKYLRFEVLGYWSDNPITGAFQNCTKLSLATRSAIEASGYTGKF